MALFRTFCVPAISKLLHQTGEFNHRTQKRYDDTGLITSEILKWGYESDRGQAAIQRMNRIHAHFNIRNEDFLYVLSTFIFEPIRWIDRFGWRKLTPIEKQACFYFWQAVGQQMHIQAIPPTYEDFEQYNLIYEQQYFCYAESNRSVGEATLNLFLSWFPSVLRPVLRPCTYALLDETLLDAVGFSHPTPQMRRRVERLLKGRGQLLRFLPSRRNSDFFSDTQLRSYPNGYKLTDVGPPHLLDSMR